MSRYIVILCGRARAGKDTLGKFLVDKYKFKSVSFADPIKHVGEIVARFKHNQREEGKDIVDPRLGITPRQFYQVVGSELFREGIHSHIDSITGFEKGDIWVWNAAQRIQESDNYRFVITDGRFQNEIDKLADYLPKHYNIVSIYIERGTSSGDTHMSETQNLETNYTIDNSTSIDDACNTLESILDKDSGIIHGHKYSILSGLMSYLRR